MKIFLIFLLLILLLIFSIFCFFNLPKKCPKCGKHKCFCRFSFFKEKKTEYRTEITETTKKDRKGNNYKEIVKETKPHEYSIYSNYYLCDYCGYEYKETSHGESKSFSSYNEYKKRKRNVYIGVSSVFGLLFCLILGSIIGITVNNKIQSEDNKLKIYINEKGGGDKYSYETYNTNIELSYSKNGYGSSINNHYKFYLENYKINYSHASSIESALFFNLSDNIEYKYSLFDELVALVNINYNENSSVCYVFKNFKVVNRYNINCSSYIVKSDSWSDEFNIYESEWEKSAKDSLNCCITELSSVCDSAGFNIFK